MDKIVTQFTNVVVDAPPPYQAGAPQRGQGRLLELASQFGIQLNSEIQPLDTDARATNTVTNESYDTVQALLLKRRLTDPAYKAPTRFSKLFKSKEESEEWTYKELNHALKVAVSNRGPLDHVQLLLQMGGDPDVSRHASDNMWKKVTNQDQTEQRNDLLQLATRSCDARMVQVLARKCQQRSLDDSLCIAVEQRDVNKVKVLLECGANTTELHQLFISAFTPGNEEIVELMLSSPKGPCSECRALGLVKAVDMRSQRLVNALLSLGAGTDYKEGLAMFQAVRQQLYGVAIAIASSRTPPRPNILDIVAAKAFEELPSPEARYRMIEICLCGGAKGQHTERVLHIASEKNQQDLVLLLLKHNVSLDSADGKALCSVVNYEYEALFNMMLSSTTSKTTLSNALIAAVWAPKLGLSFAGTLIAKGASASFKDGAPIVEAVKALRYDMLEALLSTKPSKPALGAALGASLRLPIDKRKGMITMLIQSGLDQETLDCNLIFLVENEPSDHDSMALILKAHAVPDAQGGRSVISSAVAMNLQLLAMLNNFVVSKEDVYTGAVSEVVKNPAWRSNGGLATLQFLLENGASPLGLDDCLREAAVRFDAQAVSFLSDWIKESVIYTVAFADMLEAGNEWLAPPNLKVVEMLLENGASGQVVSMALIQALKAFMEGKAREVLLDVLLEHSVDINYSGGLALLLTIRAGRIDLLVKILRFNPSVQTLSVAFNVALISNLPVDKTIGAVEALFLNAENKPDPTFQMDGLDPPLFLALRLYPSSAKLVSRLCEFNCKVDVTIGYHVFGRQEAKEQPRQQGSPQPQNNNQIVKSAPGVREPVVEPEDEKESDAPEEAVTPLIWACSQLGKDAPTPSVIAVLLEYRADVNFTTHWSKSTPLLLATRNMKPDIVGVLAKHKSPVNTKDRFSRSPLFFAAGNGDVKSAQLLIQMKAKNNDGSLHEAARELRVGIVGLLLKNGHDPDFTSTKHQGLTPLGELCMYSNCEGLVSNVDECIDLLVKAKMNPLKKWRGKTVLYLALDNPIAVPVTSSLLERLMYKHVGNEANIFRHNKLNYSPTMYLAKGHFAGSQSTLNQLIQLLKNHGAEDHYYADEGLMQPHDAAGMPDFIIQAERRRRKHEEDISREIERESARLQAAEAKHQQYMQHQDQRFQQQQAHMASNAQLQRNIDYQRNMQALEHKRNVALTQLNQDRQALQTKIEGNRVQAAAQRQQLEYKQHVSQLNSVEQRRRVQTDYEMKKQNVQTQAALASIKDRASAAATERKKQGLIMDVKANYEKNKNDTHAKMVQARLKQQQKAITSR